MIDTERYCSHCYEASHQIFLSLSLHSSLAATFGAQSLKSKEHYRSIRVGSWAPLGLVQFCSYLISHVATLASWGGGVNDYYIQSDMTSVWTLQLRI